jgi:sulfur-oxidizing protein SoxY
MREAKTPTRRDMLGVAGAGALLAVLGPRLASADPADVAEAIKKISGDRRIVEGKIKLDVPQIAENGNTVPLTVAVESPMSSDDYVKSVHIWADDNPLPDIVSFRFTPASGRAQASTRMRLARTQNIHAVAETSKGELFSAKTEIKVTIGGCGG